MQKQQIFGLSLLLAVTAAVIGADRYQLAKQEAAKKLAYQALLDAAPVAELTGEACSPDGRFQVRTTGKSGTYISGVRLPEKLQIVDTETEEVQWEDVGYVTQSALWSPDGKYLALAYGARTWGHVKIFETGTWSSWDFTMPDGRTIPEYTYFPEDGSWGEWFQNDAGEPKLLVTVGRGGDAGEQHTYACALVMYQGCLTGVSMEVIRETLPGTYDFNHDGVPEAVELVTLPAWYELWVTRTDGTVLWMRDTALPHVGWASIFAYREDGKDYLLCYDPVMYQGCATYSYRMFSLNAAGQEVLLRENSVDFDINFGSGFHEGFDPAAIAAFLEEVHGYLDASTLLMTTEGGTFRTGGSGAGFQEDVVLWDEYCPYDENSSLEENLRNYETWSKEIRGIA